MKTSNTIKIGTENGKNRTLTIEYGIEYYKGNTAPHFSITGTEQLGRIVETCGCIHDLILEHAPHFASLIALHLSDHNGLPMYAIENGFYYYQNPSQYKPSVLANHLRVTQDVCNALVNYMNVSPKEDRKQIFTKFVNSQIEIWKTEAKKAIKEFDLVIPFF